MSGLALILALAAAPAPDACESLTALQLPDARIVEATSTPEGELPALCRVKGIATPVPGSRIGFEIWLPAQGWSGRLHMVGNGGYSSDIRHDAMASLVRRGEAAAATDTGHAGSDPSFGTGHPEALADWGWRAVHETIVKAKLVVAAYYGAPARWSYFSGCSTGGGQGLMEAQRFPEDFDGVLAGAPGNNRVNLTLGFLWQYMKSHTASGELILPPDKLRAVNAAVTAACDEDDGIKDGIIGDPRRCKFDLTTMVCEHDRPDCLTTRQLMAMAAMYDGARNSRTGEQVYPGWPVGSEGVVTRPDDPPGWSLYWADPRAPGQPARLSIVRDWGMRDAAWDWRSFDWDKDVDALRATLEPVVSANDENLGRFWARGGKLILVQGWADPVSSPYDTLRYVHGVQTDPDAALYLAPGVAHCGGGPGAAFGASSLGRGLEPLSDDRRADLTTALEAWVEKGWRPGRMIAVKRDAEGKVLFSRPLCRFPASPHYRGKGDPNDERSFECR